MPDPELFDPKDSDKVTLITCPTVRMLATYEDPLHPGRDEVSWRLEAGYVIEECPDCHVPMVIGPRSILAREEYEVKAICFECALQLPRVLIADVQHLGGL